MVEQESELSRLAVKIIEEDEAVAVTTGIVKQELNYSYSKNLEHGEVSELLHGLVEEGVLEYSLGEYGEFGIPD